MISALIAAGVLAQSYYTPEEAKQLFAQANQAYYSERSEDAVEGYQKLLDHGFGGPDVLYNLGTTYLSQGDLGRAVLYLERARRAGAREDDVMANLSLARSKQLDQVVGAAGDDPFAVRVAAATHRDAMGWLFLGSWVGGFGLLFLFRFLPRGRRAWAAVAAGVALAAAIPSGLILGTHAWVAENFDQGVVISATLPARELPSDQSRVSFELHAGLKVRLLGTDGRYVRIRLPNGLVGWAEKGGISEI